MFKNIIIMAYIILYNGFCYANDASYDGGEINSWYLGAHAGIAKPINDPSQVGSNVTEYLVFSNGSNYSFETGYSLGKKLRIEGEYCDSKLNLNFYRNTLGDQISDVSGYQRYQQISINTSYSIYKSSTITPYIGVGMGLSKIKYTDIRVNNSLVVSNGSDNVFTYQVLLGSYYQFSDHFFLDINFKYKKSGDAKVSNNLGQDFTIENHKLATFSTGLLYRY